MLTSCKSWSRKNFLVELLFFSYLIVLSCLLFRIIFFGVDFTDESYYVAMLYQAARGAKPFVDDYSIVQGSALYLSPLFTLYLSWKGTTGIVLFSRFLYVIFTLLLGFLLAIGFKKEFGYKFSVLIFINIALFTLGGVYALCYDTLCALLLTTILFIIFFAKRNVDRKEKGALFKLFLAGALDVFLIFAYPSFALLTPFLFFMIWRRFRSREFLGVFAAGFFLVLMGFFLYLGFIHSFFSMIRDVASLYSLPSAAWGSLAEVKILHPFLKMFPGQKKNILSIFFPLFILSAILFTQKKHLRVFSSVPTQYFFITFTVLFAAGVMIIFLQGISVKTYVFLTVWMVFFCLGMGCFLSGEASKNLFFLIFFPSLIAALINMWSSSVPYFAAAAGLFPIVFVMLIYFALLTKELFSAKSCCFLLAFFLVTMNLLFLSLNFEYFYRDGARRFLTQKITSGPYSGLYTMPEKALFIEQLQGDLRPYTKKGYSLLSYGYVFPGAYLIEGFKVGASTLWLNPEEKDKRVLAYFQESKKPDILLRIRCLPDLGTMMCVDPAAISSFDQIARSDYRVLLKRKNYEILGKI